MNTRPMENSTWSRWGLRYSGRYSVRSSTPPSRAGPANAHSRHTKKNQTNPSPTHPLHQQHRDVAAGHRKGPMGQVDEVHQAHGHGQTQRQDEQQHAVGNAVE